MPPFPCISSFPKTPSAPPTPMSIQNTAVVSWPLHLAPLQSTLYATAWPIFPIPAQSTSTISLWARLRALGARSTPCSVLWARPRGAWWWEPGLVPWVHLFVICPGHVRAGPCLLSVLFTATPPHLPSTLPQWMGAKWCKKSCCESHQSHQGGAWGRPSSRCSATTRTGLGDLLRARD